MALTQSDQQLIEDFANSNIAVQEQARARWKSSEPYQSNVVSKYRDMHHYFNPINGDHWPEDSALRPGKIHVTTNLCKAAVDVSSRLLSLPPRFTLPVTNLGGRDLKRAEATEALMMEWLDLSGFDEWFYTYAQVGAIYGKAVLKPYWNDALKRPDVSVIENPANLRLGWGSSDYRAIDWAMYEYSVSYQEAMFRWDNVSIEPSAGRMDPPHIRVAGGDHADPLDQKDDSFWRPFFREHSEYERTQIRVWDYWYKRRDGTVMNAQLLNGKIVEGPTEHAYLADVPYIVTEYDHEPGSPEGVGIIEPIRDLQDEFNRLLSHGLQHIADDVDPAWFIAGPSADMAPAGIVPKAGEVVGVGDATPGAWPKAVNTFPIQEMMQELWNEFHRLTGLPEILFGQTPGADTSGRAIAIQVEAAANRLEPRRRRLYQGLKEMLVFWTIMAERKNPKVSVPDAEGEEGAVKEYGVGDLVRGFRRWKLIAPEITPRDNIELGQHAANMVGAKLWSRRTAMNQIGVEAPEYEIATLRDEGSDLKLSPAEVQAQLAVHTMAAQLEAANLQNEQLRAQVQALGAPQQQSPQSILQQANASQATLQQAQQEQAPTGFEDQNQPATQQGGAPPPGAPAPSGGPAQLTALSRQGEALNQIAVTSEGL
jgi:hypothetical protein